MARFNALLQSLANAPNAYEGLFEAGRGLGMTPNLMMAERQRQALEAQTKQDQALMLQTINQAQSAAEQGDMNALNVHRQSLMDIYSRTSDKETQTMLLDSIAGINAVRPAAQSKSVSNTAQSIIKTEDAIKEMEKERESLKVSGDSGDLSGVFTAGQEQALQALKSRLNVMQQNSEAVAQAAEIRYQKRYEALKQENELFAQQETIARRALSAVKFDSSQYKELSARLRKQEFGDIVDQYEKDQYALMEAREKADKTRKSKEPLTPAERKKLEDYNFVPGGPDKILRDKGILAKIEEKETVDKIRIASAENARVANAAILANVQATLETIAAEMDVPWNLFDDIYNKIEELDSVEIQEFADSLKRPSGEELSLPQIQAETIAFVKRKFPQLWKEATQTKSNLADEAALVDVLTADLLVGKGLAVRDENGAVDLSGVKEEDIRAARREVERRRSIVPTFENYVEGSIRSGLGSK